MKSGLHPSMEFESSSGTVADIGALLRASRLRRGEDLRQVAAQLRIRYVYLEAIEDGRFDELPGTTYAIGFIRTYSEYLGLDGEEIVRRFKSVETGTADKTDLVFPSIIPEHGIPGGAIVMVGLLVAVVGYGSWYFLSTRDVFVSDSVPPVPAQLAEQTKAETADAKPSRQSSIVEASSAIAAPAALTPPQPAATPAPETTPAVSTAPAQAPETAPETTAETVTASVQETVPETGSETAPETVTAAVASEAANEAGTVQTTDSPAEAPAQPVTAETENSSDEATAPEAGTAQTGADTTGSETTETATASLMEPLPSSETAGQPQNVTETAAQTRDQGSEAAEAPTTEVAALPATPATSGESRITLTAKDASWIQVRDLDANELILSKVLLKGHTYDVPNRAGLSLMTGNAGALDVTVDGEQVPTLGDIGQVRQKILLDADRLKDGTAVEQ